MENYNLSQTGAQVQQLLDTVAAGYIYMGTADLTTTPDTTNPNVCYLLKAVGTYTNFGNIAHSSGIGIALWNGTAWSYQNVPSAAVVQTDATVTEGSTKPVQSGAVYKILEGEEDINIDVDVPATANTLISNAVQYPISLQANKTYTITYTGDCKNITMYPRTTGDVQVPSYYAGGSTTANSRQFTTTTRSVTIKPTLNVTHLKFYATAANVPNTETLTFNFFLPSEVEGILPRLADIEEELPTLVPIKLGKNIFDIATITEKVYLSPTGVISANNSYFISDFIPVEPSTTYCITHSTGGATGSSAACHCLYNSEKTFISSVGGDNTTLTTTSATAYIRISGLLAQIKVQVEKGSSRTTYEPYSKIGGYPVIIEDGSITYDDLDTDTKSIIESAGSTTTFSAFRSTATLASNEILRLSQIHIEKNTFESAKIEGSFTSFQFGVGITDTNGWTYGAHWLVVDATNVKLYNYWNNGEVLANTYTHGMTFTQSTTIEVDKTLYGTSWVVNLTIYDDLGNSFSQTLPSWGYGKPFFKNLSSSAVDVTLAFMPRDILRKIWLFGDSYINWVQNLRWPYYFAQKEMSNVFSNNQPGLAPTNAYVDLESMLSTGYKPAFLFWTLGMNGGADSNTTTINASQKTVIDNVVELCEQHSITLVLATIPTVPTQLKVALSNYVRSLGVRYVDFAKAVGAQADGTWNTGLLSEDGVHPSALGAKVLATQVMVDFPEFSTEL